MHIWVLRFNYSQIYFYRLYRGSVLENFMDSFYLKSKEFLENFTLDFDVLKEKLQEIMEIIFSMHNIKKEMTVSFDESRLFGKSSSVSKINISFNKTRIKMLSNLKIDDLDENHLVKMELFYKNYPTKSVHTEFEEILYDFIKKYKEAGAQRYFDMVGSYKTIKYEILETIYHECEHVIQDNYKKFLDKKEFPKDTQSKMLIFTTLFNTIYEKLRKANIEFDYTRENYIFPIEFDARYISFKEMTDFKNLYFQDDELFERYLKKSVIIPKDFNILQTVNKIFEDYEKLYNLYIETFGEDFVFVNAYIQNNKTEIKLEFTRRYEEMTKTQLKKYFWREKNANNFIGKCNIVVPTSDELFEEIIKKFEEKLEMIDVIFDKTKRNEYLSKKNKTIPKGTPEFVIQQKIGSRVVIDFLQLVKDLCNLKNIKIDFPNIANSKSKEEIYLSMKNAISNLKTIIKDSLVIIYENILNLTNILSLNYETLEAERQKVEEKEGSFYKGKIVLK